LETSNLVPGSFTSCQAELDGHGGISGNGHALWQAPSLYGISVATASCPACNRDCGRGWNRRSSSWGGCGRGRVLKDIEPVRATTQLSRVARACHGTRGLVTDGTG